MKVFYSFIVTIDTNLHFIFKFLYKTTYFATKIESDSARPTIKEVIFTQALIDLNKNIYFIYVKQQLNIKRQFFLYMNSI